MLVGTAGQRSEIVAAFQARHDALACSNVAEVGRYPGHDVLDGDHWKQVSELAGTSDGCGAFSEYLITIPADPTEGVGESNYRFDLSDQDGVSKHYRLSAILEKTLNESELADLVRARTIWDDSFGGNLTELPQSYNYIVGN